MRISKLKLLILVLMSAIGLWASGTVLVIYYTLGQQLPICPTGNYFGIHLDCGAVLSSSYSKVFGVPLELLAIFYFAVNLILVYIIALGSDRASERSLQLLFGWRFLGVAIVPYLVFVELFLLHAVCVYCTIMHVAILLDFAVVSYLLFFGKNALWGVTDVQGKQSALAPGSREVRVLHRWLIHAVAGTSEYTCSRRYPRFSLLTSRTPSLV